MYNLSFISNDFSSLYRRWIFDEASYHGEQNEARPNVGNNEPFGAGGFHWQ
jgi:hypothetical protein